MRIAIMGAGGLGSYLGARLVQADLDVTFIARGKQLEALRRNGLQVKSAHGDFSIGLAQATDNPAEVGIADLIFFCVKSYDCLPAAKAIKPMVGSQTALIPILNGIDHIAQLAGVIGKKHVLGGAATITAHRHAPGVVEQVGIHNFIEFGEMGGGISERCKRVEQQLAAAGFEANAVSDMKEKMWRKFAMICGLGGVFSVVRGDKHLVWQTEEVRDLLRRAMSEVVAVARARDIALHESLADEIFNAMANLPDHIKPSMLLDLEQGHRLEVEALNGVAARYGKEVGIETPVNDFIYACLHPYANGKPTS